MGRCQSRRGRDRLTNYHKHIAESRRYASSIEIVNSKINGRKTKREQEKKSHT